MTRPAPVSNDLVRFLLDRLDDDDSELRKLARSESRAGAESERVTGLRGADRLRAEIIAKRHVIGDLQQLVVLRDQPSEKAVRDAALQALRALSAPYADHRAYRSEWRAPKRR